MPNTEITDTCRSHKGGKYVDQRKRNQNVL